MAHFKVRAATPEGRVLTREVEASTGEEARAQVERDGLYAVDVRPKGVALPGLQGRKGGVKASEFLVFNQGLVTLLKAGIPVVEGFETMLHQKGNNPRFSDAIADALREIRNGQPISEAMRTNPVVFPPLYTASISAGERTGDLIPAISGYIEYMKRMEAVRKKVVSAVTYPLFLSVASVAIIIFLLGYVVPSFASIYMNAGAELPLPTRVLMGVTDFLQYNFWLLVITLFFVVVGLRAFLETSAGRLYLDRIKLLLPQFGEIFKGYAIAKFARTLGMVLTSGVPLVQALSMVKGVLGNSVLEGRLEYVIKRVREGEAASTAMAEVEFMSDITLKMFTVGERAASLPAVLGDIADFNDEEVAHKINVMTDLIEPALMIIMGFVIAAIVVGLYLPIFMMGEVL
ncbi:MAG: type II secretion system F family protein [Thermodesulfobacteriota bacterium]